mgnify:FL=1
MDGAGSIPKNDLNSAGKNSEEVLDATRSEGKDIQQEQSYVVGNAIYCVYNADSEELIKEHSERSGAPATFHSTKYLYRRKNAGSRSKILYFI